MQVLLALDTSIFGQEAQWPVVVAGRTLILKGLLGDVLEPRAPPHCYFLFNDAIFECAPRKRSALTARNRNEEYDFVKV